MDKINLLEVIFTLSYGGAERLAVSICEKLDRNYFNPRVCGLYGEKGPLTKSLDKIQTPYSYLKGETLNKFRFLKEIFDLIKGENISLIHVHGFYLLLQCILPAKLAGVKIVYTEHANFTIKRYKRYTVLASILPRFVDRMTTVSNHLKNYFVEELNVNPFEIDVIYNGIDLNKFKNTNEKVSRNFTNRVHIGTVGRLNEAKDHLSLLSALSIVHGIHDDFHLTIVGGGELRQNLEMQIKALNLENHVKLLGDREEIPDILSNFDIFVLSSKREGFPIALLEAMACEKPVIATRVGGVPEVINDGVNGVLVPPEDPSALAQRIIEISEDVLLRERLAVKARKTIEETFSSDRMVDSYQNLFLNIMGQR